MLRYMLDTNICIYTIKNRPEIVKQQFIKYADRLCVSSIVEMELIYGAEKSSKPEDNLKVVESFISRLEVLPFDSVAAAHAAHIRATLEKQGKPIGNYDLQIAGHARSKGLIIVTNNTKEFERVNGLMIENWTE